MLITGATAQRLRQPWRLRQVDRVRARGKRAPVTLWEVLDALPEEEGDTKEATAESYAGGRAAFEAGRLDDAAAHFAEVLRADPTDDAAQLHALRCRQMRRTGLPADWEGVVDLS